MPASDDHSRLHNLGTVMGGPESGLRYMRRRRVGTADRNGDPLDGIVNLFDVAIVLAVGFLVAALAAAGMTGLLTSENMTIVTNPGTPEMQVIVKEGDTITKLDMQSGAEVRRHGHAARLVLQAGRRHGRLRARRAARRARRGAGAQRRSGADAGDRRRRHRRPPTLPRTPTPRARASRRPADADAPGE